MVKKILLGIICGFWLVSCNSENTFFEEVENENINLIAPNGEKIASSVRGLTTMIGEVAEKVYKEDKDIKIQDVSYYETTSGFIAKVKYLTYDGYMGSAIVTNVALNKGVNVQRLKTRAEDGSSAPGLTIYTCVSKDRKKCPDCEVDKHTELDSVRCSCSKGERKYCELIKEYR